MPRVTPILALLVGAPLLASAQSGTVRYDQATRIDFRLPPGMPAPSRMPRSRVQPMQLTYSPAATLFAAAPAGEDGDAVSRSGEMRAVEMRADGGAVFMSGGGGSPVMIREIDGAGMMMFGGPGGGGQGTVTGTYTDLSDGSYTEVREFLGRTFRIATERPAFAWKLTGEQATFLGHHVLQAIAQQDSTTIEAWFTPEIPVSAGPAQYGGLPGLILTLAVDSNRVTYTATAVDTAAVIKGIKAPSDGSKVTKAEYDKIVEEKLAEMAKQRRGRRN